jgi:hypothetical protein
MKDHYPKYGDTRQPLTEARKFGEEIARAVTQDEELEQLDFSTELATYEA